MNEHQPNEFARHFKEKMTKALHERLLTQKTAPEVYVDPNDPEIYPVAVAMLFSDRPSESKLAFQDAPRPKSRAREIPRLDKYRN
jgi:hypothetical protein